MNPTLRLLSYVVLGFAVIAGAAVAIRPTPEPAPAPSLVTVITVEIIGDYTSAMAIVHSDTGPAALIEIGVPTEVHGARGAVLSVVGAAPGQTTCRIEADGEVDEETASDGGQAVCMWTRHG